MKTPKRYPATMSVYATQQNLKNDRARWKRKNKIAQLKRTIARLKSETVMTSLPYLDTEEKLRAFTKKHWGIDIEPALVSAHAAGDSVLIFPSAVYRNMYAQANCEFASMGQITYEQQALVHPCILPVLQKAYHHKEQQEKAASRARMETFYNDCQERLDREAGRRALEQEIERLRQRDAKRRKNPSKSLLSRIISLITK